MFGENEKNKIPTKTEANEKLLGQEDAIKKLRDIDKLNENCLSQTSNLSEPKLSAQNKQGPEIKAKMNCQYNAGMRDLKRKKRRIKK